MSKWLPRYAFLLRAIIVIGLFALFFAWQTSWFDSNATWQQTTGFDELPPEKQPTLQYLPEDQPRISWLGHSGFVVVWNQTTLLLDPNLSPNATIVHRAHRSFVSAEQLPKVDAAIISHAHYDHLDLPTLENVKILNAIIVPSGTEDFLSSKLIARSKIVALRIGQSVQVKNLMVTAVTAEHNGSRNHPFDSKYLAAGYIVANGDSNLYFAGDTGWGDHFATIGAHYRPLIAILPIGGYEPYFILKNYHLSPADAVRAAQVLGAQTVIPAHFGTFRVALEPTSLALREFAEYAFQQKINWRIAPPYEVVREGSHETE